jgi:acyl-CoA synthetase (AMP-forming)/AMP-acid ligase II
MSEASPRWLGLVPPIRSELHYRDRIVRCFVNRPSSAYALLQRSAAERPAGEAIVWEDTRLNYQAFEEAVADCATGLQARGVRRGDRVALLLGNGVAFPVTLFAALRLGAIAVPISIREQTPGLAYMLSHCGAKVLVHEADLADRLPPRSDLPLLLHCCAVNPASPYGGLEASFHSDIGDQVAEVDEEDAAIILYTSGTTGQPKGAMLTHLGICHSAMHFEQCMGLTSADRSVIAVPMSHVTGVIAMIAAMVHAKATMIIMSAFKAADFLHLAERERMTHTVLVPAMYNLCLLDPRFDKADLSQWRVGGFGGAPMAPSTIERFATKLPRLALMNAYGSTETTSPATMMPPQETAARLDSVGRAVACGEILVMDENGREVPAGTEGEIWLRGPMVVKGYWDDPVATASNIVGGYWRSGDIGTLDREGYLRVFDRKKDMINRGGYKIYSVEVENVLMAHDDVVEAAVIAKACPVLGERVHAFVNVQSKRVTSEDLSRHCAGSLADYKVPESFSLGTEPLPRNANGKILKRSLRDRLISEPAASVRAPSKRQQD